jgi:hypothetical protein
MIIKKKLLQFNYYFNCITLKFQFPNSTYILSKYYTKKDELFLDVIIDESYFFQYNGKERLDLIKRFLKKE